MSIEEANKQELVTLSDVIDWGQGYDDTIIELLKDFRKFRDGYYGLINHGDNWWKEFNQGTDFDEIMKQQWNLIDANDFMNCIEKMAVAIAGTYVQFDKFVDGVIEAYDSGKGFRHERKEESK